MPEKKMFFDNFSLEKPDDDARLFRYMDFTKFLMLLDKQSLFFARADKFEDPLEGSFSKANIKLRPKYFSGMTLLHDIKTVSEFYKALVKFTVINCWHINEQRQATLWKAYLSNNNGVAISSTFSKLRASFENTSHEINIAKVKYISFENDLIPEGPLFPYFHKRKQLEDEKELRAVIQEIPRKKSGKEKGALNFDRPLCKDGINVQVNLDILIDRIYLAPKCHDWQVDAIQAVTKRYGLNKKVIKSSLYDAEKVVY